MPRISPIDLRNARRVDKFLPFLLPACRDIPSARSELRWLKEHAKATRQNGIDEKAELLRSVLRRSRNEPLQYILGSEFFGELEIKCRPGVLIPRQETAASVSYLVRLLSQSKVHPCLPSKLRVLDLCTGTGCIPLLFHNEFYSGSVNRSIELELVGVDISTQALHLAQENQRTQIDLDRSGSTNRSQSLLDMVFIRADVLAHATEQSRQHSKLALSTRLRALSDYQPPSSFDILISNPPYISSTGFRRTTSRSVRQYEPKLALVPPASHNRYSSSRITHDGDLFYPRLLEVADQLNSQVLLFEVGDLEQAIRVAGMAVQKATWDHIEVWRDDPQHDKSEDIELNDATVVIRGEGHGRSVFAYRGELGKLLK